MKVDMFVILFFLFVCFRVTFHSFLSVTAFLELCLLGKILSVDIGLKWLRAKAHTPLSRSRHFGFETKLDGHK